MTTEQLIALESGALRPEEAARCEAELASDPDALRAWLAQRQMESALRAVFAGDRTHVSRSIMEVVSGPARELLRQRVLRTVRPARWPIAATIVALAAAAAVALAPFLSRWDVFMPGIVKPPLADRNSKLGLSKQPGMRQAFMWPFAADSPWNLALGENTSYEPVRSPGFDPHAPLREVIVGRPVFNEVATMPVRRVLVKEQPVLNVRFADRWGAGFAAAWPVIVIVDPARRTVAELRGANRLATGDLVAEDVRQGRLDGAGEAGLAESGVSALGGLIRYGELARGIPHALAASMKKASLAGNLKLGTRLALPASLEIAKLGVGDAGPGFELARALQDYGVYITETGGETFALLAWYENMPPDFATHVAALLPHLQVVTDSAGPPRRPGPPPFDR